MPAKAVHNTAVTEGEWDGPAAVASMPNEEATLWYCHAWREAGGEPDAKQSYKFPHHRTNGGPAVLNGVRNALARLSNASIPEGDKAGVERHLRAHLEAQEEDGTRAMQTGAEMEIRTYPVGEMRVEGGEAIEPVITGYAAVYGRKSEVLWNFREVIEEGFFDECLAGDTRSVWNHNTDFVLGRTKNGTLRFNDDQHGLGVEIHPPETSWGQDALVSIRRGDVDQMSFAFEVKEDGDHWQQEEDGIFLRTLKRGGCARLYEVSPVTFPAYPQTSVSVRSKLELLQGTADGVGQGERRLSAVELEEKRKVMAKLSREKRRLETEIIKNKEI